MNYYYNRFLCFVRLLYSDDFCFFLRLVCDIDCRISLFHLWYLDCIRHCRLFVLLIWDHWRSFHWKTKTNKKCSHQKYLEIIVLSTNQKKEKSTSDRKLQSLILQKRIKTRIKLLQERLGGRGENPRIPTPNELFVHPEYQHCPGNS